MSIARTACNSLLAVAGAGLLVGCDAYSGAGASSGDRAGQSEAADSTQRESPVIDKANMLPAQSEAALDKELREYEGKTRNAIVVVTTPSLEGKTIDDAAYEIFNRRGIGDSKTHSGVLILLAPNQKQVRIEVGCGLENPISDAVANEIIQQDMIPALRAGDYSKGIEQGVDGIMDVINTATSFGPTSPTCKRIMGRMT